MVVSMMRGDILMNLEEKDAIGKARLTVNE